MSSNMIANLIVHPDKVHSATWALIAPITIPSGIKTLISNFREDQNIWAPISMLNNKNQENLVSEKGDLIAPENGLYLLSFQSIIQSQSDKEYIGDVEHWFEVVDGGTGLTSPRLGFQMGGRCSTISNNGSEQFFLPALSSMVPISLKKNDTVNVYVFQKTTKDLLLLHALKTNDNTLSPVTSILQFHLCTIFHGDNH